MRTFFITCFILVSTLSFAHRGDVLAIENVKYETSENSIIYSFQIENIKEKNLTGVQLEFLVNGVSVASKQFEVFSAYPKFREEHFEISKKLLDPVVDRVQIEITKIFNKKYDWGGWDCPNTLKNVNTLASEFYVEAPWRMKKTFDDGSDRPIPVHFFLHDADLVTGFTLKIDWVEVRLKNATSSSFGPVLDFSGSTSADVDTMFSAMSVADAGLSIKGFDLNSFTPTSSRTMDFDIESDFFDDYVSVDDTYWYFTFNIPPSLLAGMDNIIDVEVRVSYANTLIPGDDVMSMRVFRSNIDVPVATNYYRGDTHLHSMWTQNDAEIGLSMEGTKEAGKLIGLDWITTTDHTSDFDNYGNSNIFTNWGLIQSKAGALNAEDPSMVFIAGQEVAANNSENKLIHMLAYPPVSDPFALPFLGDGDGDVSSTAVSIDDVLALLVTVDGFSYGSHPFATEDELPTIPVDGGIWNLGSNGFPSNGSSFPITGGNIICNDLTRPSDVLSIYSNKLIKDAIKGSQIWNVRSTLSVSGITGDELNPWDVTNSGTPFTVSDTASMGFHIKKFRQGQEVVNHINQLGLAMKNADENFQNWKMFFCAGSDAHGSFNFSNTGNFAGFGTINNNAVGKLSTMAYCPSGMGANGTEVLRALYNGNVSLSDGPILNMGISTDGDTTSNQLIMGQDEWLDPLLSDDIYVNFNYITTPEFGDITNFVFVVGTSTGEFKRAITLPQVTGNNNVSYKLIDLMDSVFGASGTPTGEYMYIRAEMATYIDYSAATTIYRTNYDIFHGMTNPIWIKWETPVSPYPNEFTIYPNPTTGSVNLSLESTHNYNWYSLYNSIGQKVQEGEILTNPIPIDLSTYSSGLYTLKVFSDAGATAAGKVVKISH